MDSSIRVSAISSSQPRDAPIDTGVGKEEEGGFRRWMLSEDPMKGAMPLCKACTVSMNTEKKNKNGKEKLKIKVKRGEG